MKKIILYIIITGAIAIYAYLQFSSDIFYLLYRTPISPYGTLNVQKIISHDTRYCNNSLWARVYSPDRLYKIADCVTLSGTITGIQMHEDGDNHIYLRLDKEYQQYSNIFNLVLFRGDLITEAVCLRIPPDSKIIQKSCYGYTNQIVIPQVGTHVKIYGAYVVDTSYGWKEIHPVTGIEE